MTTREDARAKVGDTIKIIGFAGEIYDSERKLIGKTGVVTDIDSTGALIGTWGGLSILPEDDYIVIKEADNDEEG